MPLFNLDAVAEKLRQNPGQTSLRLFGVMCDNDDIPGLVQLLNENPQVASLNLGANNFRKKGTILLAGLQHVEELDVNQTNISDDGAIALMRNRHLKKLDFSGCSLSDKTAVEYLKPGIENLALVAEKNRKISHENRKLIREKHGRVVNSVLETDGSTRRPSSPPPNSSTAFFAIKAEAAAVPTSSSSSSSAPSSPTMCVPVGVS